MIQLRTSSSVPGERKTAGARGRQDARFLGARVPAERATSSEMSVDVGHGALTVRSWRPGSLGRVQPWQRGASLRTATPGCAYGSGGGVISCRVIRGASPQTERQRVPEVGTYQFLKICSAIDSFKRCFSCGIQGSTGVRTAAHMGPHAEKRGSARGRPASLSNMQREGS